MPEDTHQAQIDDPQNGGDDIRPPWDPDVEAPPNPIYALCLGGSSAIAIGILLIVLGLLAECMKMLHVLVGIYLTAVGVWTMAVTLPSYYRHKYKHKHRR